MKTDRSKLKNQIVTFSFIACAIVWDLILALDFVYGQRDRVVIIMHIVSALAWTAAAIGWFARMKKLEKIAKLEQDAREEAFQYAQAKARENVGKRAKKKSQKKARKNSKNQKRA